MASAHDDDDDDIKPPRHFGDQPSDVMYLEREGKNRVLVVQTDAHRGGNHDEVRLDPKKKDPAINVYRVMGTWNAARIAAPLAGESGAVRVIDVGALEFWLRTEGKDEDRDADSDNLKAQILVEVLKNGQPATSVESGCVTLYAKPGAPVTLNVPAPFPAITLNPPSGAVPGDQLSVRVSARHGSVIGCGGPAKGKARIEYGSTERPSKINFRFGGSTPAASTFTFSSSTVTQTGLTCTPLVASCTISLPVKAVSSTGLSVAETSPTPTDRTSTSTLQPNNTDIVITGLIGSVDYTFTVTNQAGSAVQTAGVWWITPETVIESTIFAVPSLDGCTATLTFPGGAPVVPIGCAAGPFQITAIPASLPALGTYTLTLVALLPLNPNPVSELLEFYSVPVLP